MKLAALLPCPRQIDTLPGCCELPPRVSLQLDPALPLAHARRPIRQLLSDALVSGGQVRLASERHGADRQAFIRASAHRAAPPAPEGYSLQLTPKGILLHYRDVGGLRAGATTLAQLFREYGATLPCLTIRDWPDFRRRGVLLDVSRGRVPKLDTLKQLASDLARFKINELQLYCEHTFAYRRHRVVWQKEGALTAREIRQLDTHCAALGIDLVPNQNSFGHLRHWLKHERYKHLAEVREPYPGEDGSFLRHPSTLAPNHPGSLQLLRELYDELLPNFRSRYFNVGCDETWDLGRGQSRRRCERLGRGRVYLDFLLQVQREVRRRGRRMMFWGDIILKYPSLIARLPRDVVALNWGYEADHPFEQEAAAFRKAGVEFYVCPGTSTWQTMIGRHDSALANLKAAAKAGRRHGAIGYLITDWGDGGHPQPLAVSYPMYLAGAALAWCEESFRDAHLLPVLSRDVFRDPTQRAAIAAMALGRAHLKFRYREPNATPFGATIAAPPSEQRELFCRNGLKYYARMPAKNVRAAQTAVLRARRVLSQAQPAGKAASALVCELELAARLASASCDYLLWQQATAAGRSAQAEALRHAGIRELRKLKRALSRYWPTRNKPTSLGGAGFLDWRLSDYRARRLHYSPQEAARGGAAA